MTTEKVIVKNQGGIGLSGLLLVVFVTLKLCNVIAWSWLWVMAPLWLPLAIVVSIWAIFATIALAVKHLTSKR